jgi:hypothetical protein
MLLMLLLGAFIIGIVVPWWSNLTDQWHYGDARIFQMDADVGHGATSHFLAYAQRGTITVLEIVEKDNAPMYRYGIQTTGLDAHPHTVTLSVVTSKQPNTPDLLIQVDDSLYRARLYNTGTTFQLDPPQEGNS